MSEALLGILVQAAESRVPDLAEPTKALSPPAHTQAVEAPTELED